MSKFTKNFTAIAFTSLALLGCTNKKTVTTQPIIEPIVNNAPSAKPVTETPNITYGKFSTYHWENGQHIQPATGGVLVEENGCLLVKSSEELYVPLLPHEKTTWNEATKTLTYFDKIIKVGQEIFGAGRMNVEPSKPTVKFIQQAKPECLAGRKFMVFWG